MFFDGYDLHVGTNVLAATLAGGFSMVARRADQCFAMPAFAISHPFEQPG
jgi:hypothetical protein